MTTDYKNAKASLTTTSMTDVYTTPASTDAIITEIFVANIHASSSSTISVVWSDSSDSATETEIIKNYTVPPGQTIKLVSPGKIILEAGDKIRAQAGTSSVLKVSAFAVEFTA